MESIGPPLGEQSGTIAIGCTFGVFWTALANNSKEGFLYLVLGLFLGIFLAVQLYYSTQSALVGLLGSIEDIALAVIGPGICV